MNKELIIHDISHIIHNVGVFLNRKLRVDPVEFFKDRLYELVSSTNGFTIDGESVGLVAMDSNTEKYFIKMEYSVQTNEFAVLLEKSKRN